MTCRSLPPLSEDAIVEVARGREVGRGTIAAVEAHTEHCAACAARLARERQLSQGLRALGAATAAAVPSEALERQLLAAFQAGRPAASGAWWKVAAAAAAVVAATGWWWTSRHAEPPGRDVAVQVATAPSPPPAVAPPRASTPPENTTRIVRRAPPVSAARRRSLPTDTGFVPLAAAAALPDFESGVIVRMELPLAALPAYGLEMVPGRKTPVEADLLIGQDGQARAIRLVSRSIARPGAEQ